MSESRTFALEHGATCKGCLGWMEPATLARYVDDQLVHAGECPEVRELKVERAPCPSCFIVPPASGVCETCG